MTKYSFLITLPALLTLLFCAHQLAPGGGPADTKSPTIELSVPANGSLNVPTNSKIVFQFSEWISKKNLNIISMYPPFKHKLKIIKNRIEIIPTDLLADSQSYHIIISSSLQDLRGNAFNSTSSLVFSTGSYLDSGTISGCIINSMRNNIRGNISIFSESLFKDSGYSGTPTYKLETDSFGVFNLKFIRQGNYRVVGYSSQSRNQQREKAETVYIPEDSIVTISNSTPAIQLYPAFIDTAFPRVTSIKAENRQFIVGKWNKQIDTSTFNTQFKLIKADSLSIPVKTIAFGTPLQFAILLEAPFSVAPWKCVYSVSRVFDSVQFSDTILFNSTVAKDTTRATLQSSFPKNKMFFNQTIHLVWSKPVKIDSSLFLLDSLGDTIFLNHNNGFNDTTKLSPQRSLKAGSHYKLVLLTQFGSDLSSNLLAPKDTTDTVSVVTFSTMDIDSVGLNIAGESSCVFSSVHNNLLWFYYPIGKTFHFKSKNISNTFSFDSIPAGKGTIGLLADKNNNGIPDYGSLIPWRSPEPYYIFTDTIEARARWDIDGIQLKSCPSCPDTLF